MGLMSFTTLKKKMVPIQPVVMSSLVYLGAEVLKFDHAAHSPVFLLLIRNTQAKLKLAHTESPCNFPAKCEFFAKSDTCKFSYQLFEAS